MSSADPRRTWVLLTVGIGTFMLALDTSVVNTVLPVLSRALGSSIQTIEWVVLVYTLVVGALLLVFGRLGDVHGHRPIYLAGFALFVLSSGLCAIAPTAAVLIASRAFQAAGAAMLYANAPAILVRSFPATERGRALGVQSTMTYLGGVTGPSLGGWLTTLFGWRAVFCINLPVGLFALWLSLRSVRRDDPTPAGTFDWAGAATFTAGIVGLVLALNMGATWGWTSLPIVAMLGAACLALAAFLALERRLAHPLLDLSLFRRRIFAMATVSATLNFACVYGTIFLVPFYLIEGRGFSPAHAGVTMTAMFLSMIVVSPVGGVIADRVGSRWPGTAGMVLLGLGMVLLSSLNPHTTPREIVTALVVAGVGTGTFIAPNTSALLGAAPAHRRGIASGVVATARNLGMALGVGAVGAVFMTILGAGHLASPGPALYPAVAAAFRMLTGAAALGVLACAVRGSEHADVSRVHAPGGGEGGA